jgi:hypothetical protein
MARQTPATIKIAPSPKMRFPELNNMASAGAECTVPGLRDFRFDRIRGRRPISELCTLMRRRSASVPEFGFRTLNSSFPEDFT